MQIYANSNHQSQGDGKRKAPKVDEGHSARKSVLQLPTGPAPALSAMLLITKLEAFNCRWRQQPSSRQWMQPALGNHCQSSLRAVSRPDPGGGGTGRTAELLMALDAAGAEDVIYGSFFDPALAAEAHALGIGAKFAPRFNRNRGQAPCEEWDVPFEAEAYVVALSDGRFAGRLDLLQGHRVDVGPSAARGTHGPRHLHSQPNGRPDVLRNVWN